MTIERKLLPIECLPKACKCGWNLSKYTNSVYEYMEKYCDDYHNGEWEFYKLSNHGFYIAYKTDKKSLMLSNALNHFKAKMSPDAASIAINIMVLNHFAHLLDDGHSDHWIEAYEGLWWYANEHPEAKAILGFID